jgi:hypothetical protein
MHLMSSAHAEQQLAQLANQFAHWRQSRTTRFEHIPAPLWEQAIALSQVLPLAQVAKRLRLRGSDLKKRCGAPPAPGVAATPATALSFVEVPSPPAWPPGLPATEIDLQRADGARLRIHCHEPQVPLAALLRTFLETPVCSS